VNDNNNSAYAELIEIVNAAINDCDQDIADIINAVQIYTEWVDKTGVTSLEEMLFDRNNYPLLPSDILYYQQLENICMHEDE